MVKNAFLEREYYTLEIEGVSFCICDNDSGLVLSRDQRKKSEMDLETISKFSQWACTRLKSASDKFNISVKKNLDGYEAEVENVSDTSSAHLNIRFTTNGEDILIASVFKSGVMVYQYYGLYDYFYVEEKKVKVKRLQPEVLGNWRKAGYRPMYFKGRTYMMLTGDYLENICKDSDKIDLQFVADTLKRVSERCETKNRINNLVYQVNVEKENNTFKVIARLSKEGNGIDIFVILLANNGKLRIASYTGSDAIAQETGLVEFFK